MINIFVIVSTILFAHLGFIWTKRSHPDMIYKMLLLGLSIFGAYLIVNFKMLGLF